MDAFKVPKGWTTNNLSNNKNTETQHLLKPPLRVPELPQKVNPIHHNISQKQPIDDNKPPIESVPPKSLKPEIKTCFKSIKIYLRDNKRVCEVCRICFCAIQDTDMFKLAQESNEDITQLKNMLKQVLPDLDLTIYQNSVVCKKCKELLVSSFELRTIWLATEEKLQTIIENQKGDPEKCLMLVAGTMTKKALKSTPQKPSILKELLTKTTDTEPSTDMDNKKMEVPKPSTGVDKKKILCEQCGRFLYNKVSLKRHQETHLKALERQAVLHRPSICHVCGLMCPTLIALRHHMCVKHPKKPPTHYKCTICKKIITTKYSYQEHVRRFHTKTKNYLQCHLCGKRMVWESSFREHLKTHEKQKAFTCKICDKKFAWYTTLTRHMLKHSNVMLSCEWCGKNIRYKTSLKRHIKVYHLNEGKTNCDVCGKRFINKANLIVHKIKVHGWAHSLEKSD